MPRKIVKAPQALSDIGRLYLNGLDLFGEAQAERLHREIYRRFDLLAESPGLGPERNEIAAGLRLYFLPAPVVIAYRATDEELFILRVFHGREDYQAVLSITE